MYKRYAVFFIPKGELATRGTAWLGWDSAQGIPVAHPPARDIDLDRLTRTPRKYGLHATVRAPFEPASGISDTVLRAAFAALCQRLAPARDDGLRLALLHGFMALIPTGNQRDIMRLARDVVTAMDEFRAPLDDATLAKRRKSNLSETQEAHLLRWGYPYVMEDYNFHITLTGRLKQEQSVAVMTTLAPYIAPHLPNPLTITHLTLMGEDENGMFHQIETHLLGG